MLTAPFLFIANWKAQKTIAQVHEFMQHRARLNELMHEVNAHLIICPSAEALSTVHDALTQYKNNLFLGAQGCAPALTGAFTGQVPILSLVELNCSYCIIGHSEEREYAGETDTSVAVKAALLLDQGIKPIICVGEIQEEYDTDTAKDRIAIQLAPLCESLAHKTGTCYIAYEPHWAIGTGKIPPIAYIQEMFTHIQQITNRHISKMTIKLLYGGSVSESSMRDLRLLKKNSPELTGLLIGNASLELQNLTKIVKLWYV